MRFHNSEDLFHVAQLFESEPLPSGRRIGIISNSASVGTLAADACARDGLHTANPDGRPEPVLLRLGAGPGDYGACASRLLAEAGIDALIACYIDHPEGDPEGVLEVVPAARAKQSKPAVACVVRADGRLPASRRGAAPISLFPESCVAVLARAAQRREWLARPLGVRPDYDDVEPGTARQLISTVLQANEAGGWLSRREAEVLLSAYRIPLADSHRCRDLRAAVAAAKEIGEPVLLKAEFAPGGGSDINPVLVGLDGEAMLRAGWRELQRRVHIGGGRWIGAIVERIAAPGADLLVGVLRDPELGPVIALGLGGRRAGAGEGVACRRPPATDIEADGAARLQSRRRRRSRGRSRSGAPRPPVVPRAHPSVRPARDRRPRGGRGRPQSRPVQRGGKPRARDAHSHRAPGTPRPREDMVSRSSGSGLGRPRRAGRRGSSPRRDLIGDDVGVQATYQTVRLARGRHPSPQLGACVMELASMLAEEPFSDRPANVSPVIGAFLRTYNDGLEDDRRQDLYPLASLIVGTAGPRAVERDRASRCLEFARSLGVALLTGHGAIGIATPEASGSWAALAVLRTGPSAATHERAVSFVRELASPQLIVRRRWSDRLFGRDPALAVEAALADLELGKFGPHREDGDAGGALERRRRGH